MSKFTRIVVVLDRSGSMGKIKDDTIGGFNQFLEDQKKAPGKAQMTLVLFDHEYNIVFAGEDINNVEKLNDKTFVPRGMTALLDALGRTINTTYDQIKSAKKKDRPEQVIFVVVTDGQENNSKEYERDAIFKMITTMKEEEKWQFVFLGANQDAIKEGGLYGFDVGTSISYATTKDGVQSSYNTMSDKISAYRSSGKFANFTDDERKKLMGDEK